jgi:hypothetical protein
MDTRTSAVYPSGGDGTDGGGGGTGGGNGGKPQNAR